MKKKALNPKKTDDLRKKAEEKLQRLTAKPLHELSASDSLDLIHELQVHQIELEMQNEELRSSHEALENSRSKYSDLYDFAPIGYLTFDKNGLILEANLTAAEQLGIERDSLINKPFSAFIHKDDQDILYLHRKEVFQSGKRRACEVRITRKDETVFYAQLVSMSVPDNNLRTSIINITGQKEAGEALKESRNRLESLFNTMNEGVVLIEPDGRITQANPAAEKILGLSRSEIERRSYVSPQWKIIRPDGSPMLLEEAAGPRVMKEKRPVRNMVMGIRLPDDNVAWLNVSASPLFRENNDLKGVVATFSDITEQKKAEDALKEKQVLNERLLNAIPHPAMLINTKRIVQAANKRALDTGVKVGDYCWEGFGKCEYLSAEDKKRAEENPDDDVLTKQ
jgi:PAS domain S-box-containing protein